MTKIIQICFVLAAAPAFAVPDLATTMAQAKRLSSKELSAALTNAKTLGTLVENLQPKLDGETSTFLRDKIKGQESVPVKIEKTGEMKFRVQTATATVPFEIHEYKFDGQLEVEINHHVITWSAEEKPEIFWQKISAAAPKMAAHWSPFAQANADALTEGLRAASALGVNVSVYGGSQYHAQSEHCGAYNSYVQFCGYLSARQLKEAAEFGNSWRSYFNPFCRADRARLRTCVQEQAQRIHFTPPANLAKYFDLKPAGQIVNSPESGTAN